MIRYLLFSSHTFYLLPNPNSTINIHGSSKIFTNPPNLTTHLMICSLKKVKGKQLKH
jgi:hypothetical protein